MRRVQPVILSIVFFDAFLMFVLVPLLPHYVHTLGLSKSQAGAVIGVYSAATLVFALPVGRVADRLGPRRITVAGVALLAVSTLAYAFAGSFWVLFAARGVQGVSSAISWTAGLAWLSAATPAERRGSALGTAMTMGTLGSFFGPVVAGPLSRLPRLKSLSLRSIAITDAGLSCLKEFPQLGELDLSDTRVTDAGLPYVAVLPNLQSLTLCWTAVTDEGLKQLKVMATLQHLNVLFTSVTRAGAADLVGALPGLKIDRELGVADLAATNRNLREEVIANRFREDLYYRLNVIAIHMPPLRERMEDIPALVSHFLNKHRYTPASSPTRITEEAMNKLMLHDWPGNVRELENIIQRAVVLCRGTIITPDHIQFQNELNRFILDVEQKVRANATLDDMLRDVKRESILTALRINDQDFNAVLWLMLKGDAPPPPAMHRPVVHLLQLTK